MSAQIQKGSVVGTALDPSGSFHEHVTVIEELAQDFNLPTQVVADMYWNQLARLKQGATVDLYLPLLTERRVRDSLRRIPHASKVRKAVVPGLSS